MIYARAFASAASGSCSLVHTSIRPPSISSAWGALTVGAAKKTKQNIGISTPLFRKVSPVLKSMDKSRPVSVSDPPHHMKEQVFYCKSLRAFLHPSWLQNGSGGIHNRHHGCWTMPGKDRSNSSYSLTPRMRFLFRPQPFYLKDRKRSKNNLTPYPPDTGFLAGRDNNLPGAIER